jgi:hypothetical protein
MPRRNLRLRSARIHALGTPPPLPCPHCRRRFHSKTGRTRHIHAKHHNVVNVNVLEPQGRNSSPHSDESSGSQDSHRSQDDEQSPVPSDPMPSPAPSFGHNFDMDVDPPHADRDYTPTGSDVDPSESASSAEDRSSQAPDPPVIERTYHSTMNGM